MSNNIVKKSYLNQIRDINQNLTMFERYIPTFAYSIPIGIKIIFNFVVSCGICCKSQFVILQLVIVPLWKLFDLCVLLINIVLICIWYSNVALQLH